MSPRLISLLSLSLIFNAIFGIVLLDKQDHIITEQQLMSFCMKHDIPDKDCKIPYQYKRIRK
jgi:hypothetical protein